MTRMGAPRGRRLPLAALLLCALLPQPDTAGAWKQHAPRLRVAYKGKGNASPRCFPCLGTGRVMGQEGDVATVAPRLRCPPAAPLCPTCHLPALPAASLLPVIILSGLQGRALFVPRAWSRVPDGGASGCQGTSPEQWSCWWPSSGAGVRASFWSFLGAGAGNVEGSAFKAPWPDVPAALRSWAGAGEEAPSIRRA